MQRTVNNRYSLNSILGLSVAAGLTMILTGCNGTDFNYGKVRNIIEGSPMHLDAEYVMLSLAQFQCGVSEDLWDAPDPPLGVQGRTSISRLAQKGRDLKFSDDVSFGDKRYPYAQIRGDFNIFVNEIVSDKAGSDDSSRQVEAKIAVIMQHNCFKDPLPLMGVRKGQFTQDYNPVLLFRFNNGWQIDSIVH